MTQDLLSKIKFYQEMGLWPRKVKLNYSRWLENFTEEADRKIAEQILDFFVYYSEDLVNQLLIAVIGKCGYKLQQKYPDWTHDKFKKEIFYSYIPGEHKHPTDRVTEGQVLRHPASPGACTLNTLNQAAA